ncbi:hypothetical protein Dsin_032750 [Dipteronia sinensis]|uniref:Uncharacterized protein n=1 Tax=Dipteronia sinensis TaxID=43782 RepID=A0AAD9ZI10_9ROSI|nr:hypothetical protein Dsin_032750 [Dipteronia sinensis]
MQQPLNNDNLQGFSFDFHREGVGTGPIIDKGGARKEAEEISNILFYPPRIDDEIAPSISEEYNVNLVETALNHFWAFT